jgi:hypothetical protein
MKQMSLIFPEQLDVLELMSLKGGIKDEQKIEINCQGSPAVSCQGSPAVSV